ncbi:hypothetical protein GCM10009425_26690 [Pseudomonas asuensis]|uniref:Uncharacterized protein n=1 Tax=Pseudomonas asuensis TaxID=1825787 RepID=A0ABQ2GUU2_9PSED|nr:hypothetical protein GCM10009425_26690 [Pseudomonas asuensis]
MHISQRAKEQVDSYLIASGTLRLSEPEVTIVHAKIFSWRNNVDVVSLYQYRLSDLLYRHFGYGLENAIG